MCFIPEQNISTSLGAYELNHEGTSPSDLITRTGKEYVYFILG